MRRCASTGAPLSPTTRPVLGAVTIRGRRPRLASTSTSTGASSTAPRRFRGARRWDPTLWPRPDRRPPAAKRVLRPPQPGRRPTGDRGGPRCSAQMRRRPTAACSQVNAGRAPRVATRGCRVVLGASELPWRSWPRPPTRWLTSSGRSPGTPAPCSNSATGLVVGEDHRPRTRATDSREPASRHSEPERARRPAGSDAGGGFARRG